MSLKNSNLHIIQLPSRVW